MQLKVAFLNCRSHGDCAVITFQEDGRKACIVVDGGEDKRSAAALTSYLKSHNVNTIDLMVGTHIDSDHINGLKHFVREQLKKKRAGKPHFAIKQFWGPMPSGEHVPDVVATSAAETGDPGYTISWQDYVIQSVRQNDDLYDALRNLGVPIHHPSLENPPGVPFNNVTIDLLGPDTQIPADHITRKTLGLSTRASDDILINSLEALENAIARNFEQMAAEAKRNANNQSIVFRLAPATGKGSARSWRFLFTGDAEEEAWEEMLASPEVASRLSARVLKIPHHGSARNGLTPAGATKVRPKHSVNCVGQKHGLPDEATLELLQGLRSELLCTQRNASKKHKSACYNVPKAHCPARGKRETICFTIDTAARTGACEITPARRACRHRWRP